MCTTFRYFLGGQIKIFGDFIGTEIFIKALYVFKFAKLATLHTYMWDVRRHIKKIDFFTVL